MRAFYLSTIKVCVCVYVHRHILYLDGSFWFPQSIEVMETLWGQPIEGMVCVFSQAAATQKCLSKTPRILPFLIGRMDLKTKPYTIIQEVLGSVGIQQPLKHPTLAQQATSRTASRMQWRSQKVRAKPCLQFAYLAVGPRDQGFNFLGASLANGGSGALLDTLHSGYLQGRGATNLSSPHSGICNRSGTYDVKL